LEGNYKQLLPSGEAFNQRTTTTSR